MKDWLCFWESALEVCSQRMESGIDRGGSNRGKYYSRVNHSDRNRYMQRFDPGFGFNGGSYTMQPMYTTVLNYNTEFPQLGSTHGPQLSTERQPRPLPQHIPVHWAAPSTPAGIGYGHPDTMMSPFNPSQVGARSSSTLYLHSSQYPCQQPGMPFIHHEHVHQPFAQSHQPLPDGSFALARPR